MSDGYQLTEEVFKISCAFNDLAADIFGFLNQILRRGNPASLARLDMWETVRGRTQCSNSMLQERYSEWSRT
jgi:hypothetical protein